MFITPSSVLFGTLLEIDLSNSNKTKMVVRAKNPVTEEKEWESPQTPEKPSDDREKEQLIRQYKEAKRLKDNLSDNDEPTKEETKN